MCFPRIRFVLELIYCDQEPLRLLNVIELLTWLISLLDCLQIIFLREGGGGDFSLKSLSLSLETHMNQRALKSTDLWITSLLFDLNHKFINGSFYLVCIKTVDSVFRALLLVTQSVNIQC